jgi:pimeloyl-ACP methyl ester carboxylesterase
MADSISAMFLLAPAGFGRIRLAEAVSLPVVRHVAERALPLALTRRLPVTLAYRSFVTNNVAPKREVVDRVTQADAKTVAAVVCVTQAIVAAGLSERAFHRRRMQFSGPVTAVWGTRDRVVSPEHSRGVETAFPQARIVKLSGMGHHPQHERLDEIMELVDRQHAPEARVTPLPRPAPAGAPFKRLQAA